jgi:hypothetical protein
MHIICIAPMPDSSGRGEHLLFSFCYLHSHRSVILGKNFDCPEAKNVPTVMAVARDVIIFRLIYLHSLCLSGIRGGNVAWREAQ